jgi:hypothetical protein
MESLHSEKPTPEDGNRANYRNVVHIYIKYISDKGQGPTQSWCRKQAEFPKGTYHPSVNLCDQRNEQQNLGLWEVLFPLYRNWYGSFCLSSCFIQWSGQKFMQRHREPDFRLEYTLNARRDALENSVTKR